MNGRPVAPEKINQNRTASPVGHDHLAVASGIWRDRKPAASLARRPAPGASALPAMRVWEMRVITCANAA